MLPDETGPCVRAKTWKLKRCKTQSGGAVYGYEPLQLYQISCMRKTRLARGSVDDSVLSQSRRCQRRSGRCRREPRGRARGARGARLRQRPGRMRRARARFPLLTKHVPSTLLYDPFVIMLYGKCGTKVWHTQPRAGRVCGAGYDEDLGSTVPVVPRCQSPLAAHRLAKAAHENSPPRVPYFRWPPSELLEG